MIGGGYAHDRHGPPEPAQWQRISYLVSMIEIREYIDTEGRSPYARWFNRLNAQAAARVATALP